MTEKSLIKPVAVEYKISYGTAKAMAGLTLAPICFIAFMLVAWPNGWTINRLVVWLYFKILGASWLKYISIETFSDILNSVLFAVPFFLIGIIISKRIWILVAFVLSASIEVTQFVVYDGAREASFIDVVTNTLGGVIGTLSAIYCVKKYFLPHETI